MIRGNWHVCDLNLFDAFNDLYSATRLTVATQQTLFTS